MPAGAGEPAGPPASVSFQGKEYKPLADGIYDVIIMGTGLKECILSGLLSMKGKKVLHLDRNGYYGGDCASLNLTSLYKKFVRDEEPPKAFFDALGANRDYNVDLIPKFIMANGTLVKILVATNVTRYLDFKLIDGSYVYNSGGSVGKVPATVGEAIKTDLVGFFQKRKLQSFLKHVAQYDQAKPSTWDGLDLSRASMRQLYDKFGLDDKTSSFVGHAMALHPDDSYLDRPASETVGPLRLYAESLDRWGKSPFIYPVYGLGGLPESFSRLCAINNGTFMLNQRVDEVLFNADGTVAGVRSGEGEAAEVALAPLVIGDPSYFPARMLRRTGRVIRTICIMDHPVKGLENPDSGQIIIPQSQVGRRHDIYVSVVGNAHQVSAKGRWNAIVSTTVESDEPAKEVMPGLALLERTITRFDNILDTFAPADDGSASRCFITASYDATSHFEAVAEEVLRLYKNIMGEELDLTTVQGPELE